jgi:hypothetical protein
VKPGTALRCRATGRIFTVRKKTKPKGGYRGDGVKVIHMVSGHTEQSVNVERVSEFFEVVE